MSKRVPAQMRRLMEEATVLEGQMFPTDEAEPEVTDEPVAQEPTRTQTVAPDDDIEVWKQRYRTLQGTFNSKMPELQTQVADLKAQLSDTLGKLENVERVSNKPKLTTEKDIEEFGEDMLDLITRRAKESWADEKADLLSQIDEMRRQLDGTREDVGRMTQNQQQSAQARFEQELSAVVPDWESVNVDKGFLAWLSEDDPMSGENRGVLLNRAGAQLNVQRVAVFFQQYLGATGDNSGRRAANTDTLARQVTPSRNANAVNSGTTGTQPKIWDASEWQQKYQSLRRVPPSDERDAIEAELNQAMAQGRIRP